MRPKPVISLRLNLHPPSNSSHFTASVAQPSPPFQAPRGRACSRESRALAQDGGDVSVSPQREELQREPQNKGSVRTRGGMEESSGMGPGVQACPAPLPYSDVYGSPSQSPATKPEKEQLSPAFSAEECKHSSRTNTGGGVNSSPSEEPRLPKRRPPSSGRQFPCSSYGCRLAFPNPGELAQHLHSHLQPTQSMEGKLFYCSTASCAESFPSMQELMVHTKLHYKPNRYFKCENCLLRFRTHRSLFKHLHVCSDQSHSPAPAPQPPALEKELPDAQRPAGPSPDKAPLLTPLTLQPDPLPRGPFPLLEASLYSSAALPSYSGQASGSVPPPFLPYLGPSPYGLAPGSGPQRLRPFLPAQAQGLPSSGPGSSSNTNAAVWKKNQGSSNSPRRPPGSSEGPSGHSSTSRIVWEHTRGRYTCMQCPFSTASRPAMTLHLEDHRKTPPPAPPPQPPSPSTPPQLEAQGGTVWPLEPSPGSSSGPPLLTTQSPRAQGPSGSGEDWDF
ncbi:zinc finger protein 414 [Gracilinanus agilis]|uniref:zinc finger protein 414 n=1 Tax=Gracilinanus agilis TaxID=191870 RepID=UPI001CFEFD7C|nr:zinc finger protein 414 [Gracilinanus agilis]